MQTRLTFWWLVAKAAGKIAGRHAARLLGEIRELAEPEPEPADDEDDDGDECLLGEFTIDGDGNLLEDESESRPLRFDEPAWVESTPLNDLAVRLYWVRGFNGEAKPLLPGQA